MLHDDVDKIYHNVAKLWRENNSPSFSLYNEKMKDVLSLSFFIY